MTTTYTNVTGTARLNFAKVAPKGFRALIGFDAAAREGLDPTLVELVQIRASHLNRCAYCLHVHTHDARQAGESGGRPPRQPRPAPPPPPHPRRVLPPRPPPRPPQAGRVGGPPPHGPGLARGPPFLHGEGTGRPDPHGGGDAGGRRRSLRHGLRAGRG